VNNSLSFEIRSADRTAAGPRRIDGIGTASGTSLRNAALLRRYSLFANSPCIVIRDAETRGFGRREHLFTSSLPLVPHKALDANGQFNWEVGGDYDIEAVGQ
jgi:hypothetical protein